MKLWKYTLGVRYGNYAYLAGGHVVAGCPEDARAYANAAARGYWVNHKWRDGACCEDPPSVTVLSVLPDASICVPVAVDCVPVRVERTAKNRK